MGNLSIITVNYNDKKGLQDTCRSLMAQSAMDFEWVVVDGGSSDGSVEFIEGLARKKTLAHLAFVSEQDQGIYDAMNKGVALANGKYALFLNAGDVLYSRQTVAELLSAINEHGNGNKDKPALLYGEYIRNMPGHRQLHSKAKEPAYIYHGLPTSHQAILYPMIFLEKNPYDLSYKISSDYYITSKAFMLGYPLQKIDVVVSCFRTGGTASQNSRLVIRDMARVQKEVLRMSAASIFLSIIKRYMNIRIVRILHHRRFGSTVLWRLISKSREMS